MPKARKIAPVANNAEKQETYREQINQYNKAMREGFYLQAILIDYALLEDRFRSFLYHMGAFKDRQSLRINANQSKDDLSRMVEQYKEDDESKGMGITSIKGKMKVIRCAIEWACEAEKVDPKDKYRYVLKDRLESLDIQEILCIIEETTVWCDYRNEIIHCLLNKNSIAVSEIVQDKAEEGFLLARRLDGQVRELKKGNYIRRKINLPVS